MNTVRLLTVWVILCFDARASSFTDHIATSEQAVQGPSVTAVERHTEQGEVRRTEASPWPEGVLDLTNHPLRTDGWHNVFSGCSNDADWFDIRIRYPRDVDDLVRRLSRVKAAHVRLLLSPWKGQNAEGTGGSERVGATFSIGNQAILDQWFSSLPVDENGVRVFGIHRYTAPPTACAPTLTLFVGHPALDLTALTVPPHVDVEAYGCTDPSAEPDAAPAIRAIEEFVAAHKAKQASAQALP